MEEAQHMTYWPGSEAGLAETYLKERYYWSLVGMAQQDQDPCHPLRACTSMSDSVAISKTDGKCRSSSSSYTVATSKTSTELNFGASISAAEQGAITRAVAPFSGNIGMMGKKQE